MCFRQFRISRAVFCSLCTCPNHLKRHPRLLLLLLFCAGRQILLQEKEATYYIMEYKVKCNFLILTNSNFVLFLLRPIYIYIYHIQFSSCFFDSIQAYMIYLPSFNSLLEGESTFVLKLLKSMLWIRLQKRLLVRSSGLGPRWHIQLKSSMSITRQRTLEIPSTPPFPCRKYLSLNLGLISQTPFYLNMTHFKTVWPENYKNSKVKFTWCTISVSLSN